jgi:hypothetical protein
VEAGVEGLPGPDHRAGAQVDLGVQPVERGVARVGEHERAGDERDAEQHRQRGQRVAQPARGDPFTVMRHMSAPFVPQLAYRVEHAVGGGLEQFPDQAPIGQEQHPVGVGGSPRIAR